jgi:predicted RecB family nuclease
MPTYTYAGIMATASLAESLGFQGLDEAEDEDAPADRESQAYCAWIDAYEAEALEHIEAHGYTVLYP